MDEEERDKKLRAGKEKLAAFQKKKSKKKPGHHHDRAATSSEHSTEMAHSSSLTSSSDMSLFEDSDQNQMSEDEMNTQDSKTLFKTQAKLKQATERIAELEESLEGKQLALDRVLSENAKLNGSSNHEKVTELETALLKRDEIIRQLTIKLQTAASLESDAAQLGQHVQQLQAQLINAGKLMESQNHKQIASSQALMEAKNEIGALQKCIEDKDNLLSQLSEKVHAISIEYSSLKASYEVSKQKEEESSKVVKSLMSDAEEFRKQGNVNGSMATSHSDLESKVQEVRLEMEETYGKQIALMKEELVNHYQTQIDSVTFELNTVKDHYTRLEYQQQSLEEEKLSLSSMNESLSKSLSELEANLTEVNSKLTETQVQRDEIFKLNSALNEQMEAVQAQNLYLENEKPKQKEETTSVYTENDVDMGSENNELLDKNLMLCNELEQLKNDYSDAKTLIDDLQKKAKGGRSTRFQVDSQEIVMELKQVTEQYEEALVNIALMQGKIEDYDIKCEDLSDDLQKLKERYAESDETVKNYEERVHNYEQKENSLMLELKALTDKCQKAETLNEEYRDKFVEYERQLTDYEGLTTQFNELQHECNMYQTQNDELNNKMNIQQDVLMELRAELEILTNQNQAYQEQSLFHVSQIEGLTQDNKSMQEMLARQTDEVKNLTSNLSSVSTQVDVYKDKTTSLESTIENLQKQLQDKDVVEVESKQKDMYIAELNSKINDLTASLKDLESDSSQIQKETVVVEETCVQKTSSLNQTPLQINDSLSALENQIVTIESDEIENLNLEKSDDFYQSVQTHDISSQSNNMLHCDQNIEAGLIGTNSNQSEQTLHLNADVDVTDIDADSLDGDESTQSFDSIDESNLSRNKLVTQVKELKYQNQILASDNNKLAVENTTLKSSIEKLNNELNEMSYTKSDLNQSTQTLKAENSDVTISCEMSHQGGMSQNNEVVDGLSQSKLESDESRTLTESFMVSQASLSRICFGCEQLKSEKLSIEEIHRNEIIEKQEEIDNLRHELESFETPKNGMNSVKENLEHLNQSHNDENEMLRSENEKLKQTLTVSNEREQNLQSQNERLTQQVYNLSVLHQTVSGDKENLENRFVEVAGMDNTENFVSEFINDNENGLHRETVVEKTNACPSEALSETNIDEIKSDEKLTKSEFSPEDDIDSKVLKCVSGSSVETIATPTDHQPTKPSRELSTTVRTCMPTNPGQVMNVCSSVYVTSVNQPHFVHGFVASDSYDYNYDYDKYDCCKQTENLTDKSDFTGESSFQSCSDSFDQTLYKSFDQSDDHNQSNDQTFKSLDQTPDQSKTHRHDQTLNSLLSKNNGAMEEIVNNEDFPTNLNFDSGDSPQYLEQVETENESNERSEHLRNENTILKVKLEDTQNDMSEMLSDRVELVGSMENFSDKINALRNSNQHLLQELKRLTDENSILRDKFIESRKHSEIIPKLEDKIIELVKQNQTLKTEFADNHDLLKQEHEALKLAVNSIQESSESSQVLKADVTGLYKEMEALSQEKDDMEKKMEAMEELYITCKTVNEEFERQILENSKSLQDMERWKIHAEDLESRLKEADEKYEKDLTSLKMDINNAEKEKNEAIGKLEIELESRNISLKELDNKTHETEKLQNELQKMSVEKEQLLGKCEEYKFNVNQLKTINSKLVFEKEELSMQTSVSDKGLRTEIKGLTDKCSSLEDMLSNKQNAKDKVVVELNESKALLKEQEGNFEFEINKLKEKLSSAENKNLEIEDKNVILENKIKNLHEDGLVFENQKQELDDKLATLKEQNHELNEKCDILEKEKQELNGQLLNLETQNQVLNESYASSKSQIQNMNEKCETLEHQNQDLNDKYETLEQQCLKLSEKCETLEQQNKNLNELCETLEQQNQDLNEKCETLEEQTKEINEKSKTLEEQSQNLKEKCETLEHQNKDLNEKCETLEHVEQQNKEMHEKLEKCETLEQQNQNLFEKCETLEQQNQNLSEKCETLEKQNQKLSEKCETLEQQNQNLSEKCETHEQQNQNLSDKCETLEQQNENISEKCETLEQQNHDLSEKFLAVEEQKKTLVFLECQLNEKDSILSRYENEIKELQEKCLSSENKLEVVSEQNSSLEKQFAEMEELHKSECNKLQSKVLDLNEKLVEIDEKYSNVCETYEKKENELNETVSTLFTQNQDFSARNLQLENDLKELTECKQRLESCNQETNIQNEELSSKNKILENKLAEIEKELSELKGTEIQNVEKHEKLESKISSLSDENKDLTKKLRQLELKKKAVKTKNLELMRTNDNTKEKMQEIISELSAENESLSKKFADLELTVKSMTVKIDDLDQIRNELEVMKLSNGKLAEEKNELYNDLQTVHKENNVLQEELTTCKKHSSDVESELQKMKETHDETLNNNANLLIKLKESNEEMEQVQRSLQEAMEELEQTQKTALKLQEDQIELRQKKELLEKENDVLTQQKEKLTQDIERLSDELDSIEIERIELVKSHDLTEQSLRDFQTNYDSLIKLFGDAKTEYSNEITALKGKLSRISEEVDSLRECQGILKADLSNAMSQKLQVLSELEHEQREREQVLVQNQQLQQELKNKHGKDLHNQGLVDAQKGIATKGEIVCVDQITQTEIFEQMVPEIQTNLQAVANQPHETEVIESQTHEQCFNENLENHVEDQIPGSELTIERQDNSSSDDENLSNNNDSANFVHDENETVGNSQDSAENTQENDEEFISEEELEALIQQKIEIEKKQIEYDLEEKYEIQFRQKQVELMHNFERKQKDLEKNFEMQINHRIESLRAEKDQAFVKALQKVKKDFEKRHQKELEKQRLAHVHEMAVMQDERKGGGHISGVVKKLHQENQELAEARDALLKQVELSHHQQEQLEDELRCYLGETPDDEGAFLQEPSPTLSDKPHHHAYRSQSLMLDWEFSPTSSFEHDRDPPGLHDACQRPQCLALRRKYEELKSSFTSSGFQPEISTEETFSSPGSGFKPEIDNYGQDDTDGDVSTPTTELEASFVKEALRKAAEAYTDLSKAPTCSSPKIDAFIENVPSKDDVLPPKEFSNEFVRRKKNARSGHVRSLSLTLPLKNDFVLDDIDDVVNEPVEQFVKCVSLENIKRHKRARSDGGEFFEEFTSDQFQPVELERRSRSESPKYQGEFLAESANELTNEKQMALTRDVKNEFEGQQSNSTGDSRIRQCSDDNPENHNSQGEFYEEFLSGDIENFDPNNLNEIAMIHANALKSEREVTPDLHALDFARELSMEEKLDNEKLLNKLESLKNLYCKEKQELLSKCENLTIQLETESLSRIQLEQELININEDFGKTLDHEIKSEHIDKKALSKLSRKKGDTDNSKESSAKGDNFKNVTKGEGFESVIKQLKSEFQLKSEQFDTEMSMVKHLQEQRLNEIKILYKAELRKLEIENGSLLEQNYQLENQNICLREQLKSNTENCDLLTSNFSEKIDKLKNENLLLMEQNAKLESVCLKVETDLKTLETMMDNLTAKCNQYETEISESQTLINELEEKNACLQMKFNSKFSEDDLESQKTDMEVTNKELREKCHDLEIELEYAKQNEAFACVFEGKCKQYQAELENKKDCEQELTETLDKFEKLQQEKHAMTKTHHGKLNSLNSEIKELHVKCEQYEAEIEKLSQSLKEAMECCEQHEQELSNLHEKETLLKSTEEKYSQSKIEMEKLQRVNAEIFSKLNMQKKENENLKREYESKCQKYESELDHKEKALDEIHETCSKFESAGFENEHVISELTNQCQKYQSEIQKLRAKELSKMKKTLSCSVDEIEMTDIYQEDVYDSGTLLLLSDDDGKMTLEESPVVQKQQIIEESICRQESVSQVGTEPHANLQERVNELEAVLRDKEALVKKYKAELKQHDEEIMRLDDLRQYQEHMEVSLREKDSYIKQLEEHFLQQRNPVSLPSPATSGKYSTVGKSQQSPEPAFITCSTPTIDDSESIQPQQHGNQKSDLDESFSDQSTISGDNSFSKLNESVLSYRSDNVKNSSRTNSVFNTSLSGGDKKSEDDGHSAVEMQHFAIVEEISKLRQELRETKSVYTQENSLLREALDREKWKRDSKLDPCFKVVENQVSTEVDTLKQKVSLLTETNEMLINENDKWLNRIQEQEMLVMKLKEQVGNEGVSDDESNHTFNQQLKILQQQRNELVQKLKDSENKVGTLTQSLSEKSIMEENFRREKAHLHSKLYEMEEVEKELTEKKIELEKQRSIQTRLEEMIYHRDLIERELMKQKRLLEVELAEIECKLHEKEELLEIQKNQLLEEIKQNYSSDRISDTSKLLSSSLEGSDFSFDLSMITPPSSRASPRGFVQTEKASTVIRPKARKPQSHHRPRGNVNRLELMLHDVEKEHAEAISYLKEKLQQDEDSLGSRATEHRQSYMTPMNKPYYRKTPDK